MVEITNKQCGRRLDIVTAPYDSIYGGEELLNEIAEELIKSDSDGDSDSDSDSDSDGDSDSHNSNQKITVIGASFPNHPLKTNKKVIKGAAKQALKELYGLTNSENNTNSEASCLYISTKQSTKQSDDMPEKITKNESEESCGILNDVPARMRTNEKVIGVKTEIIEEVDGGNKTTEPTETNGNNENNDLFSRYLA
jgi:hypothetical protein